MERIICKIERIGGQNGKRVYIRRLDALYLHENSNKVNLYYCKTKDLLSIAFGSEDRIINTLQRQEDSRFGETSLNFRVVELYLSSLKIKSVSYKPLVEIMVELFGNYLKQHQGKLFYINKYLAEHPECRYFTVPSLMLEYKPGTCNT